MNAPDGPAILVLGAGLEAYRSYALRSIAATAPVVLLDPSPPPWAQPLTTAQITTDLAHPEAVAMAVSHATNTHQIGGVLTYAEQHTPTAAEIAEHLNLPGPSTRSVAGCRDKATTRQLLADAGVPSARHQLARSQHQAVAAADAIGYPVVVKPRSLAGSVGVRRADNPAQVRSAYHQAAHATLFDLHTNGVLIEEYITGREISCECLVTPDGGVHLVAVTRKNLGPEPAFEETGHLVDAADPLLNSPSVRHVAAAAATAVGFTCGILHIEMRLDASGTVTGVIEIGPRLGGDLIPHLTHLATGIDLARAAADLALGRDTRTTLTATTHAAAAISFLYPHRAGVTTHRQGPTAPHPGWLERFTWTHALGDRVQPPPTGTLRDRLAHYIVTGPDAATCQLRLGTVTASTSVRIHDTTAQTACVE